MKTIIITLFTVLVSASMFAQSAISYTFDKQGRMKSEKVENTYQTQISYDKEGNIISKIVANYTGIEEVHITNNLFSIYPNPTKKELTIEALVISEDRELTLCDISGKILQRSRFVESKMQFSLENFASGVYFLFINSSGKTTRFKIIKI